MHQHSIGRHKTGSDTAQSGNANRCVNHTCVRKVIALFGRHLHRNAILNRLSTPSEKVYIDESKFPHLEAFQ